MKTLVLVTMLATVVGCDEPVKAFVEPPPSAKTVTTAAPSAAASPGASGMPPVGIPLPVDQVAKIVNPNAEAPYKGPVGKLKGTIRFKGDPAPSSGLSFPSKCAEAAATYGKKFRLGQDSTLADVLVAVTGYKGFVPAASEVEKITLHGCAPARRTIAMAFGQRLEVFNLDKIETYMPLLEGSKASAVMVAVPGGDAVKLYAHQPGHYELRDQLPKPFLTADVYVVAYATHDVTGLDGQYEIPSIPVGKVKVNALLPSLDVTAGQEIEIKEGDNTLDLTIQWTAKDAGAGQDAGKEPAKKSPAEKSPAEKKSPTGKAPG